MKQTALDLICIGRAGVDLYGEQVSGHLEDMGSFARYVGGNPANTAIGAARLGLKSVVEGPGYKVEVFNLLGAGDDATATTAATMRANYRSMVDAWDTACAQSRPQKLSEGP